MTLVEIQTMRQDMARLSQSWFTTTSFKPESYVVGFVPLGMCHSPVSTIRCFHAEHSSWLRDVVWCCVHNMQQYYIFLIIFLSNQWAENVQLCYEFSIKSLAMARLARFALLVLVCSYVRGEGAGKDPAWPYEERMLAGKHREGTHAKVNWEHWKHHDDRSAVVITVLWNTSAIRGVASRLLRVSYRFVVVPIEGKMVCACDLWSTARRTSQALANWGIQYTFSIDVLGRKCKTCENCLFPYKLFWQLCKSAQKWPWKEDVARAFASLTLDELVQQFSGFRCISAVPKAFDLDHDLLTFLIFQVNALAWKLWTTLAQVVDCFVPWLCLTRYEARCLGQALDGTRRHHAPFCRSIHGTKRMFLCTSVMRYRSQPRKDLNTTKIQTNWGFNSKNSFETCLLKYAKIRWLK